MQSDRSLRIFLGGVFLLVLATIGVYLWRQQSLSYRMEDEPEAVVFNYVLAVQREDAPMLAALMVQDENHPSLTEIRRALLAGEVSLNGRSVRIGAVTIEGDQAWVEMEIWSVDGLMGNGYSYPALAVLKRQDGRWKIDQMPYELWSWQWPQPEETSW